MADRPYTLLSCSVSLDGYLDDATKHRLLLSNDADLDRVDEVRASCDAILVGAATVRNDNPRLLVRTKHRQDERIARGLPPSPLKVTITEKGDLDACANFFATGDGAKLVYCTRANFNVTATRLDGCATVIDAGDTADMAWVCSDLHARGVHRLMVEGGGGIHTQFLTEGLADELQLVIAPFFVGDSQARRFVGDGAFPWNESSRATLAEVRPIGDVVLLRYALSSRFRQD